MPPGIPPCKERRESYQAPFLIGSGRAVDAADCLPGRLFAVCRAGKNPCIVLLWAQCPPYTDPACFSVHRPRCMLNHLGASYLVEAPVPTIEENGSDNLRTLIQRAPRRPRLPAPPLRLPPLNRGSGGGIPERPRRKPRVFPKNPNPRRFFGFFLIAQKETRRRSGETSVLFRGMFRLRAGYFPEKESSQSSPGLRARTQESRAVSLAIPAGAVPS